MNNLLRHIKNRKYKEIILNPKLLSVLLIGLSIIFVIFRSPDFGITWDVPSERVLAKETIEFYTSFGKNREFLNLEGQLQYYGPVYDIFLYSFEHIFSKVSWIYVRGVVDGLTGVLGIIGVMLYGKLLKNKWLGLSAGIILLFFPRYFGNMFFNAEDMPFVVANIFILLFTLKFFLDLQSTPKKILLNGFFLGIVVGLATAIRIAGLIWYPLLALLYIIWIIHNTQLNKSKLKQINFKIQIISLIITILVSLGLTILLIPYILIDPINNFIPVIQLAPHVSYSAGDLFNGSYISASSLPWNYIPTWILITSPIITSLLFIMGLIFYSYNFIKNKKLNFPILILIGTILTNLLAILVMHPILYDSYRHVLYIVPPMVIIAAYGLFESIKLLRGYNIRILQIYIVFLLILSVKLITDMIQIYPYEYTYFNELVGGLQGAGGKYETDYWLQCYKESADWLNNNYFHYTDSKTNIKIDVMGDPEDLLVYTIGQFKQSTDNPLFYVSVTRGNRDKFLPRYKIIHTISRFNTNLCVIKVKPKPY